MLNCLFLSFLQFHNAFRYDSPIKMSPAAAGIFAHDEDTGASPLAPLGLHSLRLRMKPSRVIQPVRMFLFICLKKKTKPPLFERRET